MIDPCTVPGTRKMMVAKLFIGKIIAKTFLGHWRFEILSEKSFPKLLAADEGTIRKNKKKLETDCLPHINL